MALDKFLTVPDGCDLHPICLTCPLPACRYDSPEVRKALFLERDREIFRLRQAGLGIPELAAQYHRSKRAIQRVIAEQKAKGDS